MKLFYSLLACAAGTLFVTSCSSDDDVIDNGPKLMTIGVAAPSSDDTRAVVYMLESDFPKVYWEQTDMVNVWGLTNGTATSAYPFTFKEHGNYHNYGYFEGEAFTATKYYVMYPKQDNATIDNSGIISATIPHVQKATSMSFDPAAAICTGATEGQQPKVSVAHACSFLKITTTAPCKSVFVEPAGDNGGKPWLVTGSVKLKTSSSGCAIDIENSTGGYSYVKLTADGTDKGNECMPGGGKAGTGIGKADACRNPAWHI